MANRNFEQHKYMQSPYDKLMKLVDTSTPEKYSLNDPKSSNSQAILDLTKENVGVGGCTTTHRIEIVKWGFLDKLPLFYHSSQTSSSIFQLFISH